LHFYLPLKGDFCAETTQRVEFKPYKRIEQAKSFKPLVFYEKPKEPVSDITSYKANYFAKENAKLKSVKNKTKEESE
jgi:hypothetical protein